ncbi:hypothetical protein [Macrococcus animalis]|uniref:hypothetical protein n=1 Tax=Macrococcus animalis TaxID=3395467 RepID=UPI0039BE9F2F
MLYATVKKPLQMGEVYLVETEDVKRCKARFVGVERDIDYESEYCEFKFFKDNNFEFIITNRTKDVFIEEVQG